MITEDTDTVLEEMRDKFRRINNAKKINESRVKAFNETLGNYEWLFQVIRSADSGKHVECLENQLEWLEADRLEGVPIHFVNHAIALCKQAIANQTPSLV